MGLEAAGVAVAPDREDEEEGGEAVQVGEEGRAHVLLLGEGEQTRVGTPYVDGARVLGRFATEVKGDKIDVVKFKRRKGYHLKKGHRQRYLKVTIEDITAG